MPDSLTSEPESDFVCDCDESVREACAGEPFYRELEDKRYCVLHFPGTEKSADFEAALRRKLENGDFDFRGVWFPYNVSFAEFDFTGTADFGSATFSAEADFGSATFSDVADFSSTTFGTRANFRGATFSAVADFDRATFDAANFRSATFNANTHFAYATFSGDADFFSATFSSARFAFATFSALANFSSVTFSGETDFQSSTFSAGSLFGATFKGDTTFYRVSFSRQAYFVGANFSGRASFDSVKFIGSATFISATFSADADFYHATFSAEAVFAGATFGSVAVFSEATFADYAIFRGGERPMFKDLRLHSVRAEHPDRISFHSAVLRPSWFVNVVARKFDFTNIEWDRRYGIEDELDSLKKKQVSPRHRLLSIACRHLADNAEENHRYEEASTFRYMSMDARRLESRSGFAPWKLSWWYWFASGYGERILRALVVLLGILFLFALLYTRVGFTRWEPRLANEADVATAKKDEVGAPLRFSRALSYSASVMTLQKPEPRPATAAAQFFVFLETILGPVQAALLALAIRRKFMR